VPAGGDGQADAIVESFTGTASAGAEPASPAAAAPVASMPADLVQAVLAEQALLLGDDRSDGRQGRWSSAVTIGANILRLRGNPQEAARLTQLLSPALARGNADELITILRIGDAQAVKRVTEAAAKIDSSPRTFRVEAARLDELVNLTGELSVAKNAIGHVAKMALDASSPLASLLRDQHLNIDKLATELQRVVLGMRVLPVRHLFQRFQRLVREMSAALNKPARLVTSGEETEADKAVIEALYEPLLHLLRNAMDHGVEEAPQRAKAGKPQAATITLRAARQGESVIVEVADDGRGIDVARVRQIAAERGLVTPEALQAMRDAEIVDLIFEPGFSTSATVTEHSGRGVGMDAVRTALARLGGHVSVETVAGAGSTVRLTLPFSVLMTQVMTVEAGGQNFGIPLDAIVETIQVAPGQIQDVGTARALVHRDRTLPVINLAQLLGRQSPRQTTDEGAILVNVAFGGHEGAFQVDRLGQRVDIMLKPMSGLLKGMPGVSGTTLLGDGSILIVLDVEALLA
jgi:two-component system chemotaxis sensor kinase CheA